MSVGETAFRGGGGSPRSRLDRPFGALVLSGATPLAALERSLRLDAIGRGREAAASIDDVLGTIRWLADARELEGINRKSVSCEGRGGRMGIGLVDLLRGENGSGASFMRGLGSNASMMRLAVFMEREAV